MRCRDVGRRPFRRAVFRALFLCRPVAGIARMPVESLMR